MGKLRSDRPILSRRDSEWLNDCQVANDNALAMRPDGAPVYFFYPRDDARAAQLLSSSRSMARLFAEQPPSRASIILPFSVRQLHWHTLFISSLERTFYHFEGFGADLPVRSPLRQAFDTSLGADGWRFVSIRYRYQSDSVSCGVWVQVARDCWLKYVASPQYGMRTFGAFMQQTLAEAGVSDLAALRGVAAKAAERANVAYICTARADMRGRLVQAALADKLAWGAARLAGFAPATALDLEKFDDALP